MIYYQDSTLKIRDMCSTDAVDFCRGEREQGWQNARENKYRTRITDALSGKSVALTAEYNGKAAGYINLYFSSGGAFTGSGVPEIVDFGVLKKYRHHGIGNKLMDIAEEIASAHADSICLGVGLYSDYGSAQRMYVKRGYIPDGSGVWVGNKPAAAYQNYRLDDSLTLYFSKKLR